MHGTSKDTGASSGQSNRSLNPRQRILLEILSTPKGPQRNAVYRRLAGSYGKGFAKKLRKHFNDHAQEIAKELEPWKKNTHFGRNT